MVAGPSGEVGADISLAGIEAGGTTFCAAICKGSPTNIVERETFPTKDDPMETLEAVAQWSVAAVSRNGWFSALTVGRILRTGCRSGSSRPSE